MMPLLAMLLAVNPNLAEGRRLYEQLHYREAEDRLRRARHDAQASQAEKLEAYDLLARALIAQNKLAEGEDVYAELLVIVPNAPAPPEAAPKVEEVFARAKRRLYPPDYVKLTQRAAASGEVQIEVADPWSKVAAVKLQGTELAHRGDVWAGPLPVEGEQQVVAVSAKGEVLATLPLVGATASPAPENVLEPAHVVAPEPEPEPAVKDEPHRASRWPGALLLTAAVALAVTGSALIVWGGRDSRAAPTQQWADGAAALDRAAATKGGMGVALCTLALVAGGASVVLFVAF
jgi:hypothetical protein